MAKRALPAANRVSSIASGAARAATRLGSAAFNKMFPTLGRILNKAPGSKTDREEYDSKRTRTSLDASFSKNNDTFNAIIDAQSRQNQLLEQILSGLKRSSSPQSASLLPGLLGGGDNGPNIPDLPGLDRPQRQQRPTPSAENRQRPNTRPRSRWSKFMRFARRRSAALFGRVGVKLTASASLATIPVAGWLAAAVTIGLTFSDVYALIQLWREFNSLPENEQDDDEDEDQTPASPPPSPEELATAERQQEAARENLGDVSQMGDTQNVTQAEQPVIQQQEAQSERRREQAGLAENLEDPERQRIMERLARARELANRPGQNGVAARNSIPRIEAELERHNARNPISQEDASRIQQQQPSAPVTVNQPAPPTVPPVPTTPPAPVTTPQATAPVVTPAIPPSAPPVPAAPTSTPSTPEVITAARLPESAVSPVVAQPSTQPSAPTIPVTPEIPTTQPIKISPIAPTTGAPATPAQTTAVTPVPPPPAITPATKEPAVAPPLASPAATPVVAQLSTKPPAPIATSIPETPTTKPVVEPPPAPEILPQPAAAPAVTQPLTPAAAPPAPAAPAATAPPSAPPAATSVTTSPPSAPPAPAAPAATPPPPAQPAKTPLPAATPVVTAPVTPVAEPAVKQPSAATPVVTAPVTPATPSGPRETPPEIQTESETDEEEVPMMELQVSADRETGEQTSRWNLLEKNADNINKKTKPSKQAELPESFNAIRLEGNTLIYDFDKIRYEAGLIKFEGEGATLRPVASPINRPSPSAAAPPPPPPPASANRAPPAGSSGTDATPISAGSAAATTGGGNATGTDTAPISAGSASAPTGGGNATGTDTAPISAGLAASPTGGGNATGTDATPMRAGPAAAPTAGGNATRIGAPSAASTGGATPTFSGGDQQAMEMIKRHEGKRNAPYKDSLGLWTVGYGHLIGDGRSLPAEWNRTFSDQEIDALFAQDFAKHKAGAERIPGFDKANDSGKAAIIDLTFNMGNAWYRRFPNASAALARGDFETFANEMQNSLWFRQVGRRGPTIVAMLRAGSSGGSQTAATQTPSTPSSGGSVAQASTERVTAGREQTMNSQRITSNFNQQSTQREQPSNSSSAPISQNVGEIPLRVRMLSTFNQLAQAS